MTGVSATRPLGRAGRQHCACEFLKQKTVISAKRTRRSKVLWLTNGRRLPRQIFSIHPGVRFEIMGVCRDFFLHKTTVILWRSGSIIVDSIIRGFLYAVPGVRCVSSWGIKRQRLYFNIYKNGVFRERSDLAIFLGSKTTIPRPFLPCSALTPEKNCDSVIWKSSPGKPDKLGLHAGSVTSSKLYKQVSWACLGRETTDSPQSWEEQPCSGPALGSTQGQLITMESKVLLSNG